MTEPPTPPGLAAAGRRLWREITTEYALRVDEVELLDAACRTADEIDRIEAELATAPTMVAGSKGQERPHPLFAEVRQHRLVLSRLLAALQIPDADEGGRADARSTAGRQMAIARWRGRGSAGSVTSITSRSGDAS